MARLLILINPFKKKTVRYFEILLFYYITPSAAGAPGEKSQSNQVPLLPEFFMNLATMKISIDEMGGSVNLAKLDDVRIRQRSVSRKGNSSKHPSDFFFEISYVHILPHNYLTQPSMRQCFHSFRILLFGYNIGPMGTTL